MITIDAASSKLSMGKIFTLLIPIKALASFTFDPEENMNCVDAINFDWVESRYYTGQSAFTIRSRDISER